MRPIDRRFLAVILGSSLVAALWLPTLAIAQAPPQITSGAGRTTSQRVQPGHRYAGGVMTRQQVVRASAMERGNALARLSRQGQRAGGVSITRDLEVMTRDATGRDPTFPAIYRKATSWLATRLQEQGVLPAGDGRSGLKRYLQEFEWDQRYASGRARSANVVGIRRGDGSTNEAVLVVAHLDGLSLGEKRWYTNERGRDMAGYQGANDNASAVAAALYISDALGRLERVRGKPLRRDVIFLFPSAEEEGLKGTEAFARYAQQFAGKKIVGAINFEMVGRGDPQQIRLYGADSDAAAVQNPLYQRAMALAPKGKMAHVVPGPPRDRGEHWYTRSDHYVTAQAGIPSVLYLGEPGDYHTSGDNLAGIDRKTNLAVARHALRLVTSLASDPAALPGRSLPVPSVNTGYSGQVYPAK